VRVCIWVNNTNVSVGYNHKLITRRVFFIRLLCFQFAVDVYLLCIIVCVFVVLIYMYIYALNQLTGCRVQRHNNKRNNVLYSACHLALSDLPFAFCLLPFAFCFVPCWPLWPIEFELLLCFEACFWVALSLVIWVRYILDICDCSPGCQLKWRSRFACKISHSCLHCCCCCCCYGCFCQLRLIQ